MVVTVSVSAAKSYQEGETSIYCETCTYIDQSVETWDVGDATINDTLNNPTIAKLESVAGISMPSTDKYYVYITNFFGVNNECNPGGSADFTVYHDKIIAGSVVFAVHYSYNTGFEKVNPLAVDRSAHTAKFHLKDTSPVAIVIAIPKNASQGGVVDTATR